MLSAIFVDRPRLAIVIALVTTIAGAGRALRHSGRPISRHRPAPGLGHDQLPGAIPRVVDATVAQPIEAQVVGVDKMIYMKSVSGDDGSYSLTASFELGTDPDINTVNVNNRVQMALAKLPPEVRQGVTVKKKSSALLGVSRSTRRSTRTIRSSSRTTSRSICSTRSRARPASAMRAVGAAGLCDTSVGSDGPADRP